MMSRAKIYSWKVLLGTMVLLAIAGSLAGADYPQIRVNSDNTTTKQNEQQICINPTDSDNLVACWRDFRLGYRQVGVGYSLDGGYSWVDYLIGGILPWDSDPVLVVHSDGTFYLVVVNFQSGGDNQLAVHRSTDKGMTWDGPFTAVYSHGQTFEDKEWMAVDRTGGPRDGHLYIAWARFNDVEIMCVTSTDRAETWTSPVQVSDEGVVAQWPVPIVLANGNVLIAWDTYYSDTIAYDISTDGGATWGTDRVLTETGTSPGSEIIGGILVFPYPSLVVDETDGSRAGWVYCVYADEPVSTHGMDIWCRRSTDHGESWSDAVRVNDDPMGLNRDQFHPWVTCDAEGRLVAMWYDRRDDGGNYEWHIYMSRSHDGGITWEENIRVTDVPSSPADASAAWDPDLDDPARITPSRAGLIGEYSGVAVSDETIHPVWTDTRNGHQDTYTSVVVTTSDVLEPGRGLHTVSLRGFPNPARRRTDLHLDLPAAENVTVEIHDPSGRLVRAFPVGRVNAGETVVRWDGLDASGEASAAGVYFVRVRGIEELAAVRSKIVLTR